MKNLRITISIITVVFLILNGSCERFIDDLLGSGGEGANCLVVEVKDDAGTLLYTYRYNRSRYIIQNDGPGGTWFNRHKYTYVGVNRVIDSVFSDGVFEHALNYHLVDGRLADSASWGRYWVNDEGNNAHTIWRYSYRYNSEGYMIYQQISMENLYTPPWEHVPLVFYFTHEYTYSGGNLIYERISEDNSPDFSVDPTQYLVKYEYYPELDSRHLSASNGFFLGKSSRNLLKSSLSVNLGTTEYVRNDYEYNFDATGKVRRAKKTISTSAYPSGISEETYNYKYDCSY